MASAWISKRLTGSGQTRYRVGYRLGGRESALIYAGSFRTQREARARQEWVRLELAAQRVPDLALLDATAPTAPTFAEVATRWQASRVDVRENTRLQHRSALGRILPLIGTRRIDTITTADIAALVAHLAGQGKARATIQKSITATAMVLDFAGIKDNPARDHVVVRLPREEPHAMEPPRAEHVEAVGWVLTVPYTIALLALDATGARVGELEAATLGDLDESRSAWLVRASVAKTRQARWVTVPDDLYAVIIGRLPAREDRDAAAPLFADVTGDRLRTAIGRACRDAGVPRFSPHDLRHRRISLWHRQRVSWAEIGERVGQRNLMTTANTYTHALIDSREVDRALILAEHVSSARTVLSPVLPQDAK